MGKYSVTIRVTTSEIVEADNPYAAAVVVSRRRGDGVEIADVRPARSPAKVARRVSKSARPAKKAAKKAVKKAAKKVAKAAKKTTKKRRTLSPEARARVIQNLAKARAARSKKLQAAKKATKKRTPAKKR